MSTEANDQNCLMDQGEPNFLKWLNEQDELDWNLEDQEQIAQQANSSISADTSVDYAIAGSFSTEVIVLETTDLQSQLSVDVPFYQSRESTTFQAQPTSNNNNSMRSCLHSDCGQAFKSDLKWLDELDELDRHLKDKGQISQQANNFSCFSADTSVDYAIEGSFSTEVIFPETTDLKSQLSIDVPFSEAKESTTFQAQSTSNHNNSMRACQHPDGCQTFKSLLSLCAHRQIHRSNWTCQFCGKTFCQRGTLRVHTRIHTGERPFVCPHCSSCFKQSGHLTTHLRTHTGERPYACHFCSATFRQATAFTLHIRMHKKELPHRCSICAKAFLTKQRLRYHLNTHTGSRPYVCSQCSAAFRQKTTLESHRLIHADSKPHCCLYCSKNFRQKSSLLYHLRWHSGEKPYPCEKCGKQFRSNSNLRAHQRIHK